ncbi:DNA-binding protein [Aeromonas salmonicida]|uniref:DNA-binding protein n=1 Tax=Aeromonas salmonicida TaxID=645 RepID=UPI0012D8C81D|nr:DNA-binding protein [Aeromonas salmonicida]MUG28240.1 DNA-binding protein [Aeromonas salmonicida]
MTARIKPIRIPSDVSKLPLDYPFGNRVSESLEEYAKRQGMSIGAIKKRADRGQLPILQDGPGAPREVNLYALFLQARYQAERYVTMTLA